MLSDATMDRERSTTRLVSMIPLQRNTAAYSRNDPAAQQNRFPRILWQTFTNLINRVSATPALEVHLGNRRPPPLAQSRSLLSTTSQRFLSYDNKLGNKILYI